MKRFSQNCFFVVRQNHKYMASWFYVQFKLKSYHNIFLPSLIFSLISVCRNELCKLSRLQYRKEGCHQYCVGLLKVSNYRLDGEISTLSGRWPQSNIHCVFHFFLRSGQWVLSNGECHSYVTWSATWERKDFKSIKIILVKVKSRQ